MPVQSPHVDPKRQLARKLFDAALSQVPLVGGPYAAMLSITHPSKLEILQVEWQKDITEAVNKVEQIIEQLIPEITISDTASAIGLWISKNSESGRRDPAEFSTIVEEFPNASRLQLEDACGELGELGLVTLSGAIGHKIVHVRPTYLLFEIFDPIAMEGVNPRVDAAEMARFILRADGTVSAERIMENFGWSVRRFNPAMGIVASMIGDGRKSGELHPSIACRYVMPGPEERSALRRFADGVLGTVG